MKKIREIVILVTVVITLGIGGYFGCTRFLKKEVSPPAPPPAKAKTLSIPKEILKNKFGFLSGGPEEIRKIKRFGASWVRPHPGPFLWDSMQSTPPHLYKGVGVKKGAEISFEKTDELVKNYQKEKIGILPTLWPFADWDQQTRANFLDCKVSEKDEFLANLSEKRFRDYLPTLRCNPNNWEAYKKWVSKVVERYDGDGRDDMPGLKIPLKYWEVMNEPDLTSPEGEEARLDFYKENAPAYAELLIKTSKAIREADPQAKVVIAGAAGGNEEFLNFYREVFKNKEAISAFDIANIHCISNDDFESFNVEPYKKLLEEFGIAKPIWVTEAEAIISEDPDINATQTLKSTKKALDNGAERIFFTRYDFESKFFGPWPKPPLPKDKPPIKAEINGRNPAEAYQTITHQ